MPRKNDPLRTRLGGLAIEDSAIADNLSIALCSYFEDHMERPEDDPIDDELGWGKWVIAKCDEALDRIAACCREDSGS